MDELIKEALRGGAVEGGIEIWRVFMALSASTVLCLILAYFYRVTHSGLSYSVSFLHTMVIMGVTVSLIMIIIGSNIARAFALVGALSIIRFRTAIKDPRDVAFIFMTMAVGMACGTGFYLAGGVFALFASALIYFLHRFDVGQMTTREVLLKVHLPENLDYHRAFNDLFQRFLTEHSLLSIETIRGGTLVELVYSVELRPDEDDVAFMNELRAINGNNKVALLSGRENVNV